MNENLDPSHLPAESDPVLDRHLASLGRFSPAPEFEEQVMALAALDRSLALRRHFAPAPGFEDRVMAQVRLPAPAWSRRLAEWRQAVLGTRRGRSLVGGLAACSVISITLAGTWAFANPDLAATVLSWLAAKTLLPAWQYSMRLVASFISTAAYTLSSLVAPTGLLIGGVASLLAAATSAVGLRRLMTRPAVTRNFPA